MGAWSHNPLDNDYSLDWLSNLFETESDLESVNAIFVAGLVDDDGLLAEKDVAIATAAEIVAIAKKLEPSETTWFAAGIHGEIQKWIAKNGIVASDTVVESAKAALAFVLSQDHLFKNWNDPSERRRVVQALFDKLDSG